MGSGLKPRAWGIEKVGKGRWAWASVRERVAFGHRDQMERCDHGPTSFWGLPRCWIRGGWEATPSTPQSPERPGFSHRFEAEVSEL